MRAVAASNDLFSGEEASPRVPARVRWCVWAFLAAFAFTGLAEVEAWPLTGWRLFSGLRHERSTSWAAFAVDDSGKEIPFSFASLPPAYRWGTNLVGGFANRPAGEQAEICDAWAAAARAARRDVAAIRIYRVERVVSDRVGERGAGFASRTLTFTCSDGSVLREP